MDEDMDMSPTQKGRFTESLVASTLILASLGRLSPFIPISDDCGIDLIVLDKQTHRTIALQVKSRVANPARSSVQFNVRKSTIGDHASRYLLGVILDQANAAMATSWLIPMSKVPELAVDKPEVFSLSPSLLADTRGRYREFRFDNARELTSAIIDVLHPPRTLATATA